MKSINDIVKKVDIVNIVSSFATLNKSGTSFKTTCNVHLDSSPSLFVNPKKQIYKCFVPLLLDLTIPNKINHSAFKINL